MTAAPEASRPSLADYLGHLMTVKGSDLHLKVGSVPHVRVDGRLEPAPFPKLRPADTSRLAVDLMPKPRAAEFERTADTDFAYSVAGMGRFRVNVLRQRGSVGLVLKRVPPGARSFAELGLPAAVEKLAEVPRGLVLVTGPTGSGRTSTVAAMIDHINRSRRASIVTIEDPIEVLHADVQSLVSQRELGTDTVGYAEAMRRVLRQDPDVVFVGELRDVDTVTAALTAAETGQLVISTLPTATARETIDRVIDFYPPHQQRQVRLTLASVLRGIVSQRLLERTDAKGLAAVVEVLVATNRVFDHVVDPAAQKTTIDDVVADGTYHGMQPFDAALLDLVKAGTVGYREALAVAVNPTDFRIAAEVSR